MKLVQDFLIVVGILLGALFIALAWILKWLFRPACVAAVAWVIWHFVTKYW